MRDHATNAGMLRPSIAIFGGVRSTRSRGRLPNVAPSQDETGIFGSGKRHALNVWTLSTPTAENSGERSIRSSLRPSVGPTVAPVVTSALVSRYAKRAEMRGMPTTDLGRRQRRLRLQALQTGTSRSTSNFVDPGVVVGITLTFSTTVEMIERWRSQPSSDHTCRMSLRLDPN